jgi:tetratricopeptide (TPR) repeat protein
MRVATAIVVAALLGGVTRAEEDAESRARAHYQIGVGLYRLGDYRGALKEFAAGYDLAHKAGFLLNLGQTHRKLGDLARARDFYRQFLDEAPAGDPARPQARQVLEELDEALRRSPPPTAPPPSALPPTAPPPEAAAVPANAAPGPRVGPPAVRATTHRHRRALQIAGITLGIAGVGLVGGGIGAAFAADNTARELNRLDQSGAPFDADKDAAYGRDRALEGAFFGLGGALAITGVVLLSVGAR